MGNYISYPPKIKRFLHKPTHKDSEIVIIKNYFL